MKLKKILNDTVGITIGAVGISEANKIPVYGNLIGSTMGAGMVTSFFKKKKGGF